MSFDTHARYVKIEPRDTLFTIAETIRRSADPGGGTDCSAPLKMFLCDLRREADLVIYLSDNESWVDTLQYPRLGSSAYPNISKLTYMAPTPMAELWGVFQKRVPGARLVCIDLAPNKTAQVKTLPGCLNIGGFSDNIFQVIAAWLESGGQADAFVAEVEKVVL